MNVDRLKAIITAWQSSKNIEAAAATARLPIPVVLREVERLRSKGVELQTLASAVPPQPPIDYGELKTFASDELAKAAAIGDVVPSPSPVEVAVP